MKKFWLLAVWFAVLMLAGCSSNCNCNCNVDNVDNDCNTSSEYKQFCLNNGWTYYQVTAPDEEYWECSFPSWIGCRDDILMTDRCNFVADTSNIDTEEERIAGCEESVQWWMNDMLADAVFYGVERSDETDEVIDEKWDLSFIRRELSAKYDQDWHHWKLPWTCEANFVDWSLWVSFGEAYIDEE